MLFVTILLATYLKIEYWKIVIDQLFKLLSYTVLETSKKLEQKKVELQNSNDEMIRIIGSLNGE